MWLLGVVVAVGLSTAAVGLVGDRVTDRQVPVVSAEGVEDELAGGTALGMATSTSVAAGEPALGPPPDVLGTDTRTSTTAVGSTTPSTGVVVAPDPAAVPAPLTTTTAPVAAGLPPPPTTAVAPVTTAPPAPVDEVYATVGGTVAVRCTGSTIELRWATPAAGFGIDGSPKAGPGEVEVRFRGEESEVRIRATCQGGVPVEAIEER